MPNITRVDDLCHLPLQHYSQSCTEVMSAALAILDFGIISLLYFTKLGCFV